MEFLYHYGLFLAKAVTIVVVIAIIIGLLASLKKSKTAHSKKLKLTSLNDHYEDLREQLLAETSDDKAYKQHLKALKKEDKARSKTLSDEPRLFVLDFDGDIAASDVDYLREHISAILQVANAKDCVLLRLESGGGYVHSYGLGASELARFKGKVPLTIAVDKVAASGGYMMACVADELIAAPFAIIGSVGVIGAMPNFHDLLEKNLVHYEQHTAGKYKRTLTMFGENTDADRAQFQKELTETHGLFKAHIHAMRPQIDVDAIATGETWYGQQAVDNHLIDKVETSDDYLLAHLKTHQIVHLEDDIPEPFIERLKSRFLGKVSATKPFKSQIL